MQFDYFVYMVRCTDGKYYVGVTNELRRRLYEHNQGLHPYSFTYKRRPVTLVYHAVFQDIWEAIQWEKQLKGWGRKKKEALMRGDQKALELHAKRSGVQNKAIK